MLLFITAWVDHHLSSLLKSPMLGSFGHSLLGHLGASPGPQGLGMVGDPEDRLELMTGPS
jgi:hypothetical protein